MGSGPELGDGVGALCPGCTSWWRTVDELWPHLLAEHPVVAARLRRAARSTRAQERQEVRTELHRELEAGARLAAETFGRSRSRRAA